MKYFNNCTAALAAGLSQNFLSPQPFDANSSSLPDYLTNTGVLLSMCAGEHCDSVGDDMNHLSGSWVQNSTTGVRVYDPEYLGVGVILDPRAVSIQCLYPLDAATAQREQAGCGPLPWANPKQSIDKEVRKRVYREKIRRFGRSRSWDSIPCSEWVKPGSLLNVPFLIDHQGSWTTSGYLDVKNLAAQVGRTICYNDIEPNFDFPGNMMLLYVGDEPWDPSQWQSCTDSIQTVIQEHPSWGIWNEVVMEVPDDMASVVQALFYTDPSYREQGYLEAERLGKPLLELHSSDLANLFQCPLDGNDGFTAETTDYALA